MEFLTTIFDAGKELIAGNYVTMAAIVLPFVLPNALVEKTFHGLGVALSMVLRQKAGPDAERRIEGYLTGTIDAATTGLKKGMDEDNR